MFCFVFILYPPRIAEYIPGVALLAGITVANEKNTEKEIELTVAVPTEKTLNIILKTPKVNRFS